MEGEVATPQDHPQRARGSCYIWLAQRPSKLWGYRGCCLDQFFWPWGWQNIEPESQSMVQTSLCIFFLVDSQAGWKLNLKQLPNSNKQEKKKTAQDSLQFFIDTSRLLSCKAWRFCSESPSWGKKSTILKKVWLSQLDVTVIASWAFSSFDDDATTGKTRRHRVEIIYLPLEHHKTDKRVKIQRNRSSKYRTAILIFHFFKPCQP